ncbi:hypothetical protein B4U80_13316, partial [Leptotrombidium deliense]
LIDEKLEKMKQELKKMIESNSIQSGSKDVMDFSKNLDQLSKRLGVHARPAVYEGCPLGWSQSNGKCYFVGPKATFKENKDYCELFNATMVRVTEAFVNDLVKLEPHKPHWLASSDAKPSDDCQAYMKHDYNRTYVDKLFIQNGEIPSFKRSMTQTEAELLENIKQTNDKLYNFMKDNKDSVSKLRTEITDKMKEDSEIIKKREEELIAAMEKKFEHKLETLKAEVKNNAPPQSTTTPNNNAQSSNAAVPADFQSAVNSRLNKHSKFLVHNDVAIHRLTAVALQLKDALMHPTLHRGCPLGFIRAEGSCVHIGPKASFHENKKYCELFNSKMITTETKYGEIIATRLAKYSPEIGVWMQSLLPKNEYYANDGYKSDLIDSLKDLKCTAFIPLNGKWVTGNCNKQFNTICEINADDQKHEIKDFSDTSDKFLTI